MKVCVCGLYYEAYDHLCASCFWHALDQQLIDESGDEGIECAMLRLTPHGANLCIQFCIENGFPKPWNHIADSCHLGHLWLN